MIFGLQPRRPPSIAFVSTIVVAITLGALLFFFSPTVRELATSPELLRARIQSFGVWAPIVIISYHILQVIFAPIPGQAVDVANGYIFGPWIGPLISLTGIGFGSLAAIWLARQFGRPFVQRLLGKKAIQVIDRYSGRGSLKYFFLFFLLPGFPDDLLCFALGLTKVSVRRGVFTAVVGRAPGVVGAVLIGATGQKLNMWQFLALILLVVLIWAAVAWYFRKRLSRIDKLLGKW